jgi:hypothetical protein
MSFSIDYNTFVTLAGNLNYSLTPIVPPGNTFDNIMREQFNTTNLTFKAFLDLTGNVNKTPPLVPNISFTIQSGPNAGQVIYNIVGLNATVLPDNQGVIFEIPLPSSSLIGETSSTLIPIFNQNVVQNPALGFTPNPEVLIGNVSYAIPPATSTTIDLVTITPASIAASMQNLNLSTNYDFRNARTFDELFNGILNSKLVTTPPLVINRVVNNIDVADLTISFQSDVNLTTNTPLLRDAFYGMFSQAMGFDPSGDDLGQLSTISDLIPSGMTGLEFKNQLFEEAFSAYLKSDLVKNLSSTASSNGILPDEFFTNWSKFLTATSRIGGAVFDIQGTIFPFVNTYKEIYQSLVPNASDEEFQAALSQFYKDAEKKAGYFIPSHFLDDWIAQAEADRKTALGLDGLASITNSNETAILFRVFSLLESMLTALQNVAISQAQKETFYANIQSDYTNLISKIPVYTIANLRATGFTEGDNGLLNNRLQAITNKNQSYTQNLQAFRDLFGDQAKQQQTAIDQSNQEVTQQANLATTILQQMSTIVQSIFSH